MDEGVIKYKQEFTFIPPLPLHEYRTVEQYRKILHGIKLIGAYDDGLGFGNISQRKDYLRWHDTTRPQFIISGTQTGHIPQLTGEHYTRIVDFDVNRFTVTAQGSVRASSETVTHGSIYEMNPYIRSVVHFHNLLMWQKMIDAGYTATGKWVLYGTQEMALAVKECVGDKTQGIFVLKGHKEGGVAFGPSLNAVMNIIGNTYKKLIDSRFSF